MFEMKTGYLIFHLVVKTTNRGGLLRCKQLLVGCKNQALSESYAKQLYTRKYLRNTSVTGRLGDIQVNEQY
jgi:hypothetical protein